MRTAAVVGIVLIGLGVLSLAYFMFPIGFLIDSSLDRQKTDLIPPILGAIALIGGFVLLVAVLRKGNKDKSEP
jgi:lipid-A-disaccharide synthase-like uncharacterized protein